jgi:hypothetical protein
MPPGPLKQTARDEQFGSHFHHHPSSRAAHCATLDQPSGSQRTLRARRRWLFDIDPSPAGVTPGRFGSKTP